MLDAAQVATFGVVCIWFSTGSLINQYFMDMERNILVVIIELHRSITSITAVVLGAFTVMVHLVILDWTIYIVLLCYRLKPCHILLKGCDYHCGCVDCCRIGAFCKLLYISLNSIVLIQSGM